MITDEQKAADVYHASLEPGKQGFESALFSGLDGLVAKPACFDSDGQNQQVQKLGVAQQAGPGNAVVGMGKVLKVMAGDVVTANVKGWYDQPVAVGNNPQNLPPILTVLSNLFTGGVASLGTEAGLTAGSTSVLSPGIQSFLSSQNNYSSTAGAYLNWILLDEEQFKLVTSGSGSASLLQATDGSCGSTGVLQAGSGIGIEKNGYLYIYVSNTSTAYPVYFDQLHIEHTRGALLEENHYYPFGLVMNGISSKALSNTAANRLKYNGKEEQREEFSDGSGLEWLDYGARMYDNQVGRWFVVDCKAGKYTSFSPYNYTLNNPIFYIDRQGMEPDKPSTTNRETLLQTLRKNNINDLSGLSSFYGGATEFGSGTNAMPASSSVRYLYSKRWGWIDMKHFASAANVADGIATAKQVINHGEDIEIQQSSSKKLSERNSSFSYEDLISNLLGTYFESFLESDLASGNDMSKNLEFFLMMLDVADPTEAPNYKDLPESPEIAQDKEEHTVVRNYSYNPLYTKKDNNLQLDVSIKQFLKSKSELRDKLLEAAKQNGTTTVTP